jgi:hypothetical protein
MGYQYALHQHKKKLRAEKSELTKSQESNNASSRSYWNEYSETSDSRTSQVFKIQIQHAFIFIIAFFVINFESKFQKTRSLLLKI